MKNRIIGIDVARALAVIGMIIVNFKVVLGEDGVHWLKSFANAFDGKAAATFVVLAGVGLALMTKTALKNNDKVTLKIVRIKIAKRALFLCIVGFSYITIWPADILHFYGVYMAITILLLSSNNKTILISAISFIVSFPILMIFWNYDSGWDFDTLAYQDFWTLNGFIRNLFFNGYHPVIPWTAFMLFGYWFGKKEIHSAKFVKKTFWISTVIFSSIQVASYWSIVFLSEGDQEYANEITEIIGTNPMPPLPVYMFSGISIAFVIITACILISKRFEHTIIIDALNKTGQLALTFYVAHVVIGMGIVDAINPSKMGEYTIQFSLMYAIGFSLICILFAVIWRKYKKFGPLEWIMRKVTD
ncbi:MULTISPECIES: DUF418 domain-containing protein [unclassified Polaribacter]|uniref:DUF418 domain-containing protein n=1 Tax=unclassified Polaribacter TaxID=196858 RepID=UPI0011BF93DB|nr:MULTISPECIES: DUF418 domain-containing protein [unclassified Polaribacter]TXD50300.1 DUF418 domain-containing protein [Polaribacter sp. IC063]TXD57886.1 DUF418 domain-containing protein [Polaribacter sp. IC066]